MADPAEHGTAPAALVHLDAYPGESAEALRRVLGISQPATARIVDRPVAAGLLERRPGPDRRMHALVLTPRGHEEAKRVLARRSAVLVEPLAALDDDEQGRLTGLLEKLTAALADDRPAALTTCRLCDRRACTQEPGCPLDHTVPTAGRRA